VRGLDCFGPDYGQVVEQGNETLSYIKCGKFID